MYSTPEIHLDGNSFKISYISLISPFSRFHHDYNIYTYYTRIADLSTTTKDKTNYAIHRIFNANLYHSTTSFTAKYNKKSSLGHGF